MKASEKAKELVDKFKGYVWTGFTPETGHIENIMIENSIQCALICVDKIVENNLTVLSGESYHRELNYWQEVGDEIKKLK